MNQLTTFEVGTLKIPTDSIVFLGQKINEDSDRLSPCEVGMDGWLLTTEEWTLEATCQVWRREPIGGMGAMGYEVMSPIDGTSCTILYDPERLNTEYLPEYILNKVQPWINTDSKQSRLTVAFNHQGHRTIGGWQQDQNGLTIRCDSALCGQYTTIKDNDTVTGSAHKLRCNSKRP